MLFGNDREQNCYQCLLVLRQHNNVIQYKESECYFHGVAVFI